MASPNSAVLFVYKDFVLYSRSKLLHSAMLAFKNVYKTF